MAVLIDYTAMLCIVLLVMSITSTASVVRDTTRRVVSPTIKSRVVIAVHSAVHSYDIKLVHDDDKAARYKPKPLTKLYVRILAAIKQPG